MDLVSISDEDREMIDELVNWFTDLKVRKTDANRYAVSMYNHKLTTVARLKKYVDKHGYGVLRDELEIDDMDADEIEEALSSSKDSEQSKDIPGAQKDVKDPSVATNPVKTTVDAKLIRTDADIRDAVKLWCSNRAEAENKYGHISDWDTSAVTNMRELFEDCKEFNDDVSGWNVSQVTNMSGMFYGAAAFNQAIGQWNVSQVTNMDSMYYGAAAFNQDIGQWNVSQVTAMAGMFDGASRMQNANKPPKCR
jgi:surface protein